MEHHWPGNVRELQNIVERSFITGSGGHLGNLQFGPITSSPKHGSHNQNEVAGLLTYAKLERLEIDNINKALRKSKGKISGQGGAAELLGIKPTTLASKIKKFQINGKPLETPSNLAQS